MVRKTTKTSPVAKRSVTAKEAPKRALTAYFLWLKEERKNIYKAGMAVTEVTKKAGKMWREMTTEAKAPWQEAAQADKQRYQDELAAFQS